MKTEHDMMRIYDPENDQTWEVPRQKVTSVFAQVTERWVANVLVPEAVVRELVTPDFLEPVPTQAGYVLSLCAIFMKHAAPEWAPLKMGPASRNCALRVACRDTRDGSDAVWVDHRYSDSLLVEALAKLGFPEVQAKLKVNTQRDFYGHRIMEMATADNMIDLHLVEYPDAERVHGKAFVDTETFEDYFMAGVRSYGPANEPRKATIVDLHKRSDNHFEAMRRYFGVLRTAWGNWQVDSVYRTVNGLYEWRYEGDVTW
ncbi:MAG TPA: hypothetical protein DCX06_07335 [Opitutae bacterium]|nr:hypothetical protein [Opitutae bacterium]